jgi:hypothetical protein
VKTLTKPVYYCDHCGRHRLVASVIERHEETCTLNPQRECRWCRLEHENSFVGLALELRRHRAPLASHDIKWLRDNVNGCPACMLAALRQSGVEYHFTEDSRNLFDYKAEVERFRKEEQEAQDYAEMRAIEAGWA